MFENYNGVCPKGFVAIEIYGKLGDSAVSGMYLVPSGYTPTMALNTLRLHALRPSQLAEVSRWQTNIPTGKMNQPLQHASVLRFTAAEASPSVEFASEQQAIPALPRPTAVDYGLAPVARTSLLEKVSGGLGWLIALPIVAAMYMVKGGGVGVARAGLAIGRKAVKPVSLLSVVAMLGGTGWVWWQGQNRLNEDYGKSGAFVEEFACETCYTVGRTKADVGHAVLCPTCGVRTMTRNISVRKDFEARPYFWVPQTQSVRTEVRDPDTGEVLRVSQD